MRKITISAIVALITYSFSSCIFEDRSTCPAYLHLSFPEMSSDVEDVFLIIQYENGSQIRDTLPAGEFDDHIVPVSRGRFYLSVFGNIDKMVYDDGYVVPVGCQTDSIYTDFRNIVCDDDIVQADVSLQKAYTRLHLRVMGYDKGYDSMYVSVNSTAIGFDLYGNIKAGEYRYQPSAVSTPHTNENFYEYSSRIITRSENVSIDIYVRQKDVDILVGTVDISEILRDHEEFENSESLFVLVDFSKSYVFISSTDWDYTGDAVIKI